MSRLAAPLFILSLLAAAPSHASAPEPAVSAPPAAKRAGYAVTMKVGETTELKLADIRRVALGNPAVIRVRGHSPGETPLIIWSASSTRTTYTVKVVP